MARTGLLAKAAQWWLARESSGTANPAQWFLEWARGGAASASGVVVSQLKAMQEVTCMACVLIRAGDLAKCPVHVYRISADGEQIVQPIHAAERLLRQPNDWQTPLEFIEQMQGALLLKSNAYAPIRRNGRGEPIALIPVNPDRVTLYEAPAGRGGDLFYQVTRGSEFERAQLADFPERIPAADMLHLRGLSLNGLTGLSRIWMARESIGLSLAQEETAARLFGNGARPSFALKTEKHMTDPVWERTKARLRDYTQGKENVGEILLLGDGMEPTPLMMNLVDAEFAANRRAQIEEIARAFDVPPSRLGLMGTTAPANILQAHQMYLNNTIATDAKRWESKLNQLFGLDGVETFIEFDLDSFNLADPATRVETGRVAIVGGQITPNEWRRGEGKGKKPGGDTLFRPMNVVPMDTPVSAAGSAGPGSDTTGAPAPGGSGDPSGLPGKAISNGVGHA